MDRRNCYRNREIIEKYRDTHSEIAMGQLTGHTMSQRKITFVKMVVPQLNDDDQWNYLGMFPDYASAVREYTQRTLTKPDDTLIAINGVFRTLQPDSGEFFFGLPSASFLQALLWYPEP